MDRTAVCWGTNPDGQLGDGTNVSRTTPTRVAGATDVVEIAIGARHTCVRLGNGAIRCWGARSAGQLGDGSFGGFSVPMRVVGINDAAQVSAGGDFTCALRNTGQVICWGNQGAAGQLGDGWRSTHGRLPVSVSGLTGIVEVSAGRMHACARGLGGVWCWGDNRSGQLGDGSTMRNWATPTPVAVLPTDAGAIGAIRAGGNHSCAILGTELRCWGNNTRGQLGIGNTGTPSMPPVPAMVSSGVLQFAMGIDSVCALTATGTYCWGDNATGQLGFNRFTMTTVSTPMLVPGAMFTQIDTWLWHTCAVDTSNRVSCWGANNVAQLGRAISDADHVPMVVGGVSNIRQVTVGFGYSCALTNGGTVLCWGGNTVGIGELGNGSYSASASLPGMVSGLSNVTEVSAGDSHTCARLMNGEVWCWGDDTFGQVGVGFTYVATVQW